jgi:hypothetical protein
MIRGAGLPARADLDLQLDFDTSSLRLRAPMLNCTSICGGSCHWKRIGRVGILDREILDVLRDDAGRGQGVRSVGHGAVLGQVGDDVAFVGHGGLPFVWKMDCNCGLVARLAGPHGGGKDATDSSQKLHVILRPRVVHLSILPIWS